MLKQTQKGDLGECKHPEGATTFCVRHLITIGNTRHGGSEEFGV